jgi:SAM-dependent methyltransferase
MLIHEAERIRDWINALGDCPGSVCLNIGSSTAEFRQKTQPFIQQYVIHTLEDRGWKVVNCDMKAAEGVDQVGDLMSENFRDRLKSFRPRLLLCSNLLEHVPVPSALAEACGDIVHPGGYCLITVPRSYPYHPDPLDTLYRPSPAELASLLPTWTVVKSEEIACGRLADEIKQSGGSAPVSIARNLVRALLPFYKRAEWYPAAHRLLWLVKTYRVSAVLLRKPESA